MQLPDPAAVAAILREVAAEEILPRFRALRDGDVREKAPGDVVTVADEAAERALTRRLTALLPGSVVLGEEAATRSPELFERLEGDAPVWVVDPLDGTANFAAGEARFGMIVALVSRGVTRSAWIYDPVGNRMGQAVKGEGAWIDGTPCRVAAGALVGRLSSRSYGDAAASAVAAAGPYGVEPQLFCAAYDYLDLASGRIGFVAFRKSLPWDHAAGVLLHAEAGGVAAHLDGEAYRASARSDALLIAPTMSDWNRLAGALRAL